MGPFDNNSLESFLGPKVSVLCFEQPVGVTVRSHTKSFYFLIEMGEAFIVRQLILGSMQRVFAIGFLISHLHESQS